VPRCERVPPRPASPSPTCCAAHSLCHWTTLKGEALITPATADTNASQPQVKLSVRIACPVAERLDRKAHAAGLSRGAYLTGLINGAPAVVAATDRRAGFIALSASGAELALLSRDIHHLTHLLRSGEFGPAREYRDRLETLDADVRQHLDRSAAALAELAPPLAGPRRVHLGPHRPSGSRPWPTPR
jgi:hypothetical protein